MSNYIELTLGREERGYDGSRSRASRAGPGYAWIQAGELAAAIGRSGNRFICLLTTSFVGLFDRHQNFVFTHHVESGSRGRLNRTRVIA